MLVSLSLSEIAKICHGELVGSDAVVSAIKTDTREDLSNALFLALKGDSFDGHDYLAQAFANNACGVLVEKTPVFGEEHKTVSRSFIKVEDTLAAYGLIARFLRDSFHGKVIAVTGSNGKTTVKEWLSQCLATQHSILKTEKNNNNQVGVPLTLCGLEKQHEFAVVEAGTSYIGEIPKLAKIINPDIAAITNASGSHLSGFGSLEGIAIEKGALLSGLSENGLAILNRDDDWFDYWCSLVSNKRRVSFGFSSSADMFASGIKLHKSGSSCVIHYDNEKVELHLATPGKHQIANAMVVLICLLECGFSIQRAVHVLAAPLQVSGRLEVVRSRNNFLILNDSYNASPKSVEAAIDVLSYQDEAQKWLVLGALKELGDDEYEIHKKLGEYAYRAGTDCLVCVGEIAAIAGKAFQSLTGKVIFCENHEEAIAVLQRLDENNAVLIKGARSSRMEKIIEKLVN